LYNDLDSIVAENADDNTNIYDFSSFGFGSNYTGGSIGNINGSIYLGLTYDSDFMFYGMNDIGMTYTLAGLQNADFQDMIFSQDLSTGLVDYFGATSAGEGFVASGSLDPTIFNPSGTVPEARNYALLFGFASLSLVIWHRRRKQAS